MSQNVPNAFQIKYQNNIETILQKDKAQLIDAVTVTDDVSADIIKVVDTFGGVAGQEADERHGTTKWANTPHGGIYLGKKPEIYYAELCDNSDKLSTGIGLMGQYTQEGSAVVNRAIDQRILEGFYGSILTKVDELYVSTPFPGGLIIQETVGGAAGAQRMNTKKLKVATKQLQKQYVDISQPRYMVLTAEQGEDLLDEIPATSSDFARMYGQVGSNGQLTGLLGWTFIYMELSNPLLNTIPALSLTAGGLRRNPFWVKSGIRANFWQRLRTKQGEIPEKLFSEGILAGTTLATTRTQAGRCGIILNSEA